MERSLRTIPIDRFKAARDACRALELLLRQPAWLISIKPEQKLQGYIIVVKSWWDRPHIRMALPLNVNGVPVRLEFN